jgi:hypothetical protein
MRATYGVARPAAMTREVVVPGSASREGSIVKLTVPTPDGTPERMIA